MLAKIDCTSNQWNLLPRHSPSKGLSPSASTRCIDALESHLSRLHCMCVLSRTTWSAHRHLHSQVNPWTRVCCLVLGNRGPYCHSSHRTHQTHLGRNSSRLGHRNLQIKMRNLLKNLKAGEYHLILAWLNVYVTYRHLEDYRSRSHRTFLQVPPGSFLVL